MNTFTKYYVATGIFLVGFLLLYLSSHYWMAAFPWVFFGMFVVFAYSTFGVGCWRGKRLAFMTNGLRHGLPGRYCTRCRADLMAK